MSDIDAPTARPGPGSGPVLPTVVRGRGGTVTVLLHGFGMRPAEYRGIADGLARDGRVLVPDWLETTGRWSADEAVAGVVATLGSFDVQRTWVVGHSFGGALAARIAVALGDRVDGLILANSLALSPRWELAWYALRAAPQVNKLATGIGLWEAIGHSLRRGTSLARAGWWGFRIDQGEVLDALASASYPRHVVWSTEDPLVPPERGRQFAERLGADWTVVGEDEDGDFSHNWPVSHPDRFIHLVRSLQDAHR